MTGIIASDMKKKTRPSPAPAAESGPLAGFQFSQDQFRELADLALKHARQLGVADAGVEVSEGSGLSVSVRCGALENVERNRDKSLGDRKSTRLNSSHIQKSRMPSSA